MEKFRLQRDRTENLRIRDQIRVASGTEFELFTELDVLKIFADIIYRKSIITLKKTFAKIAIYAPLYSFFELYSGEMERLQQLKKQLDGVGDIFRKIVTFKV